MERLPNHNKILDKLEYFYISKKIPHIIFHGTSGSGKRTILDQFIGRIYDNDKGLLKRNVMYVNCAHGKGIKFIREDIKFFAKTNIQSNNGMTFKSIILLNADYLTIDAQSALRRCIELFSYNTRFFILVENKQRLLNPILSRFCEIYVSEFMENGKIYNLHQYFIKQKIQFDNSARIKWVADQMELIYQSNQITHEILAEVAEDIYENGSSCLDIIEWIQSTDRLSTFNKSSIVMCFNKIKQDYRCEKLLMLYIFDYMFLR